VIAKQRVLESNQGSVALHLNDLAQQNTLILNEKVGELEKLEAEEIQCVKKLQKTQKKLELESLKLQKANE